jgi:hypothetical protein
MDHVLEWLPGRPVYVDLNATGHAARVREQPAVNRLELFFVVRADAEDHERVHHVGDHFVFERESNLRGPVQFVK